MKHINIKKLQIEITSYCNLDCDYCIKNSQAKTTQTHLTLESFEEILQKYTAQEFVLYGFGEPLLHPQIENLIELARTKGKVFLLTNGTIIPKLKEIASRVDSLGVSVDSLQKSNLRKLQFQEILEVVDKLTEIVPISLSTVLSTENIDNFLTLVTWAGERHINISATNLVPYNQNMARKALFLELSKKAINVCQRFLKNLNDAEELLKGITSLSTKAQKSYQEILDNLEGYHLNLEALVKGWPKIEQAQKAEKILEEAREKAFKFNINIDLPRMFADEKRRTCPFHEAIFIRSDGRVAPCAELAYTHPLFVNFRQKEVQEYLSFSDEFALKKKDIVKNYPWCGDCQLVDGCWFLEESMDCYGNYPSCSECLYSAGLARCIL
ncbi:Radical SAM domain protein [Thermodesulfatator indicus DSM 15286]|uniref:Radical SAM domain protein n=1 Tax=Thermodesulfatator indicus (strain DSM 15286 / JCM 11887 / CIR29812) TaxID=667014 RepID=F8ACW9_THEID|nr:radical SAM protein [Thermodesulfatator indicus]AEH44763.1 Radical SAM domain protein [Thermodesulfatator indicus DSM 15286]